jgi:glucose/arabinose dehydrogenase
VRLSPVLDGFQSPLLLVDDPATRGEAYVVEQGGRVWRVAQGVRDPAPFLDLTPLVRSGGEQGLLGLAFGPAGETPRRLYASYTDAQGDSVLARYLLDAEGHVDPASAEPLLKVDQPYANHNGGHVLFGPDGFLYVGLGDGGSAGDPQGNGQDPHALLGSLLRLDVRPATGYAIPPDNPYAEGRDGRPEVWAKGLRNPWRFTFDRETGDLYIGDVGQNKVEEIDFQPAGQGRGANYGWNVFEGASRYKLLGSPFSDPVPPVAEYGHEDGCSVTGGHVYRGAAVPALRGVYLFGDYCSGSLWGLVHKADGTWAMAKLLDTGLRISSFAEDEDGELYVVDHGGSIQKVEAGPGTLPAPLSST